MSDVPVSEIPRQSIDLTAVPADQRDRVWFENYYAGGVPQFTVRAVVMGGIIGSVMAVSNLYTTLKLGWSFGVAITASVLSYTVWNAFMASGITKSRMTLLENNCMQSTASSAGASTGTTLATAAGALLLMNGDQARLGWFPLTVWVFLVAVLGTLLAIPMKRQMINQEQLPFPSGIAAAETLRSLYAEGAEAMQKAQALINSMIFGAVWGLLRSFGAIPDMLMFTGAVRTRTGTMPLSTLGVGVEPSALMIAAGMIVGTRVSTTMFLGAILNWFILAPMIMSLPDWVEPGKTFVGHLQAVVGEDGAIVAINVNRWSLWLGTSMMVTSGLTGFAMSWRTILRAFQNVGSKAAPSDMESQLAAIEVPNSWLAIGIVPVTVALIALCYLSFGIAPWLAVVSVVLSAAIALVASRATGETDTTPVGAMGKITQLIFAVLAPANFSVNLLTAGITAGAASSSADLLTDLKSGYLLGANPRQQFLAQLSGVFFGTLTVIPAWYLLVPNKAALEAFHPPATNMWFAVAQALSNGIETIPLSARYAIVIGGFIGVLLPVLETLFPKARPYLPSAMGLGLSFVVSFSNSVAFFLGALITWRWETANRESADRYVVPVASGIVAGESLAAAGYAVLNALKFVLPG